MARCRHGVQDHSARAWLRDGETQRCVVARIAVALRRVVGYHSPMQSFESPSAFYLGRRYDRAAGEVLPEDILYDAKDLTTHAVCVGMTGSGKTGLCLSLIEEAALDGVPVLAIDPKGDLGNLLLTFPDLLPQDFEPWVDPGMAARKGRTVAEEATKTAMLWKEGLAGWGQDGARIRALRAAADVAIYTPGSGAGLPLTVLRSFDAPPESLRGDVEAMAERVGTAVSGLLGLLGLDTDPLTSRDHLLLTNIIAHEWREGRDLEIVDLIRLIQTPPIQRLGVMDLESIYPAKDRFTLAMRLNGLLASPTFAPWMEGEPLDVQRLLYTAQGKPRVSILSIAHLPEDQRMFFVTLLLNEVVAWVRTQAGTSSLRAMLYMDEVFGYFPPTANPPSKKPMLTLLKQARAHGLGCVLATQNPVDLDYKGLANTGTWFLGRLQTERDKLRVLDGLEGASSGQASGFDRQAVDALLSGLSSRVFLLHNVHEREPVLFHTRWAMSYLRGPLTREHIERLMAQRKQLAEPHSPAAAAARGAATVAAGRAPGGARAMAAGTEGPPVLPDGIDQRYLPLRRQPGAEESLVYRPALLGQAELHYVLSSAGVDEWRQAAAIAPLQKKPDTNPWDDRGARLLDQAPDLDDRPDERGRFADLPAVAAKLTSYKRWTSKLKTELYQQKPLEMWTCRDPKATSKVGETEREFAATVRQLWREERDRELAKLEGRYAPKLASMENKIRTAQQRVERERDQRKQKGLDTVVSIGSTILGALFGRRKVTATKVGRAVRGAGRIGKESGDVARAQESLAAVEEQLRDLEQDFRVALEEVREHYRANEPELERKDLAPRKSDLTIDSVCLLWTPWAIDAEGIATPLGDS